MSRLSYPYLAVLPLILSAAFAAAQSASAPQTRTEPAQPAPHFDPRHPCALPTVCTTFGEPLHQKSLPFTLKPALQESVPAASITLLAPGSSLAPKTCYTVRAYEYSTTDPATGQVRRTGMTTCQPAADFRMKSAAMVLRSSRP